MSKMPVAEKIKFGIPTRPLYSSKQVRRWGIENGLISKNAPKIGRLSPTVVKQYLASRGVSIG